MSICTQGHCAVVPAAIVLTFARSSIVLPSRESLPFGVEEGMDAVEI